MASIRQSFSIFMVFFTILFLSLVLINAVPTGFAQTGTNVSGIISSDTTWNQAGSPYNLIGNVLVIQGAVLTIEPGAVINTHLYYIMINGTLLAKGTAINQISFQSPYPYPYPLKGNIIFTEFSVPWNSQTGAGSIISNTHLNYTSVTMDDASPLITNNIFTADSYFESIIVNVGSPLISNNTISGGRITVNDGDPTILFNTFPDDSSGIIVVGGTPIIAKNTLGLGGGIQVNAGNPIITDNNVFVDGQLVINSGIIERNNFGNLADVFLGNATFENNTVRGIQVVAFSSSLIRYNNLVSIRLSTTLNVNATNNWWGSTNESYIKTQIYDYNNDFSLGKVFYTPFLTAPNSQGVPDPNAPVPTATPSPIPEFPLLAILLLFVSVPLIAITIRHRKTLSSAR